MVDTSITLLILTLNMNCANTTIKRQILKVSNN